MKPLCSLENGVTESGTIRGVLACLLGLVDWNLNDLTGTCPTGSLELKKETS